MYYCIMNTQQAASKPPTTPVAYFNLHQTSLPPCESIFIFACIDNTMQMFSGHNPTHCCNPRGSYYYMPSHISYPLHLISSSYPTNLQLPTHPPLPPKHPHSPTHPTSQLPLEKNRCSPFQNQLQHYAPLTGPVYHVRMPWTGPARAHTEKGPILLH